ncbi:MAG: energy transducer TonB [Chitinophagaceae bacterium]
MKKIFTIALVIIATQLNAQNSKDSLTNLNATKDSLYASVQIESYFEGGQQAWVKFLQKNLKSNLAAKYLVIPKGQQFVKQTVYAQFTVDKNGELSEISYSNENEVHPALGAEVIRVMKLSPKWTPAFQNGRVVKSRKRQAITFLVNN